MAGSKSRAPSIKIVENWIRVWEARPKDSYVSFLKVRDVPSLGLSAMVKSNVTGRSHHYFSNLEYQTHLVAEYRHDILDIREQFALLPWEETQMIARTYDIPHPRYPKTGTPIVVTTDLVLTLRRPTGRKIVAVSVKPKGKLSKRNLQKLLIEKVYWQSRGITWLLVTQEELAPILVANLEFFTSTTIRNNSRSKIMPKTLNLEAEPKIRIVAKNFSNVFESYHSDASNFNEILFKTSEHFKIDPTDGHILLSKAIWARQSRIDIHKSKIDHRSKILLMEKQ